MDAMCANGSDAALTALKWTHVEFPTGDVVGKLLALWSLLPVFSVVALATIVLVRRDVHAILLLCGVFLNEAANSTAKRTFRQPRPDVARMTTYASSQHGMPSAHVQLVAFITAYAAALLLHTASRGFLPRHERIVVLVALPLSVMLVATSRVYLGYHTLAQVVVAAAYGGALGALFFTAALVLRSKPAVSDSKIVRTCAEWFSIKDSTRIHDVLRAEQRLCQGMR
mmetsp:Transcript_9999/g.26662  ORF Transcript_9999/g.26662 Transcript_9999/m.26662 type:complete len:226 (-) Transcript_9999:1049-1726(-)